MNAIIACCGAGFCALRGTAVGFWLFAVIAVAYSLLAVWWETRGGDRGS